ncbi:MAG TPA: VOC family protein [Solirubrobacterales bacterium]|nr:VOC family protein [Solirubrobacterales bacterium]
MKVEGTDFAVVFVTDYLRAVEFYGGTLGLEHSQDYGKIPGGEFETGNLTLQVLDAAAVGREFAPSGSPIALRVADVAAARAELEGAGVEFLADTIDSGVCFQALFKDPDGNVLILHHRYAPR